MDKNTKLTSLDFNQYTRREHEENYDAKRVFLVGGKDINVSIDNEKIANSIKESLKNQLIQTIEIPVIIKEIEYKVIEVPVIVKEIEYKTIEKPIVIKEIIREKENDNSLFIKIGFIIQTICILGFCIFKLIKV
jgi:hypothetical protein